MRNANSQAVSNWNLTAYVSYSLFISFFVSCLYFYLMRDFIRLEPVFDEIWKLDVITGPSILKRISTLPYALAPGWAFAAKAFFSAVPENFYTFRIFAFLWILPSIFLLPLIFSRPGQFKPTPICLFSGVLCLVYAKSTQSLLTYLNPYTFEIFYSAVLLFLCSRWSLTDSKGRYLALAVFALTPFFTFAPLFYLPFLYSMVFLRTADARSRLAIISSAVVCAGIFLYLYKFIYVSAKSPYMLWFWEPYLTHGSSHRLLQLLSDFPRAILDSILSPKASSFLGNPLGSSLIVILFGFVMLGIRVLYRLNRIVVLCIVSASLMACVASYFSSWPLSLSKDNRINIAFLWPYYFAFGVGMSTALEKMFSKIRFVGYFSFVLVLLFVMPALDPYPAANLPDIKDKKVYSDIALNILPSRDGKSLVFPMHYSTDAHANYLLQNRWPDHFIVVDIGHAEASSAYLEKIRSMISENRTVDHVYIIMPHFLFNQKIMADVEKFSVRGFVMEKHFWGGGSLIVKLKRGEREQIVLPVPTPPALILSKPVSRKEVRNLNADCNFEAVDGVQLASEAVPVHSAGDHEFTGWVVDAQKQSIPARLKLVIQGVGQPASVWTSDAVTWVDRSGVAKTRGYAPKFNNSGFSFKVDTSALPAGVYHVFASSDDEAVVCDTDRQIRIND